MTAPDPAPDPSPATPPASPSPTPAAKVKVATVWLDGCSGCHMSFLDIDERLLVLAEKIDLVYSPLVDNKEFPENVDLTIIEGAIATTEDVVKARKIRAHSKVVLSLGDCAVTGNVPSMRNTFPLDQVYDRAYLENVSRSPQRPTVGLPPLLDKVRPVHEFIKVDIFVPGCPPPADAIYYVLTEILAGRTPNPSLMTRFGR
jgi:NAD-reducing hydrogenase small subunit